MLASNSIIDIICMNMLWKVKDPGTVVLYPVIDIAMLILCRKKMDMVSFQKEILHHGDIHGLTVAGCAVSDYETHHS